MFYNSLWEMCSFNEVRQPFTSLESGLLKVSKKQFDIFWLFVVTNFIRLLKKMLQMQITQAEKTLVELLTTHTYKAEACVEPQRKPDWGTCMTTAIIKDAQVTTSAFSSQCGSRMTTWHQFVGRATTLVQTELLDRLSKHSAHIHVPPRDELS